MRSTIPRPLPGGAKKPQMSLRFLVEGRCRSSDTVGLVVMQLRSEIVLRLSNDLNLSPWSNNTQGRRFMTLFLDRILRPNHTRILQVTIAGIFMFI